MNNPARNRIFPTGVNDFLLTKRVVPNFDYGAHEQVHAPKTIVYTTKTTLDTNVGSRMYVQRPGIIVNARANVQVAPGSTLTWDILKNGTSIFGTKPTILSGNLFQEATSYLDNYILVADDYLQVQITATGSATGPMVVTIEYLPSDFY